MFSSYISDPHLALEQGRNQVEVPPSESQEVRVPLRKAKKSLIRKSKKYLIRKAKWKYLIRKAKNFYWQKACWRCFGWSWCLCRLQGTNQIIFKCFFNLFFGWLNRHLLALWASRRASKWLMAHDVVHLVILFSLQAAKAATKFATLPFRANLGYDFDQWEQWSNSQGFLCRCCMCIVDLWSSVNSNPWLLDLQRWPRLLAESRPWVSEPKTRLRAL